MWYIAGLGNPGEEYARTRHNTGRIVLETVAKKLGDEKKLGKEKVTLIAPDTFMNNSGKAFKGLITDEKKASHLIVIHDDFSFPVGTFKISFNRSSGGHNGVESIIKAIKTQAFIRIRVGICPATPSGKLKMPHGAADVEKLILGEFKKAEFELLKKTAAKIFDAISLIITESKERAMTEYNQ